MDWFRLYGEFATDPKVQMMSEAMQRRLVMLFCLECSNGIETFHVTERETSIAFALRVTEETLAETKAVFLAKGFINDDWTLSNWDKRQYVSDSSTARVKAHREKKKREAAERETRMKRSSNAPEQNRTDTEETTHITRTSDSPPAVIEDHTVRPRFAITDEWEPNPKSFTAVLHRNGMAGQTFEADQLLEFRSYWISRPDDLKTQAQWEHALAQQLKRQARTQQAQGLSHETGGRTAQRRTRNAHDILTDPNW